MKKFSIFPNKRAIQYQEELDLISEVDKEEKLDEWLKSEKNRNLRGWLEQEKKFWIARTTLNKSAPSQKQEDAPSGVNTPTKKANTQKNVSVGKTEVHSEETDISDNISLR